MALTLQDCLKAQTPSVAAFQHKLNEGNAAVAQRHGLGYALNGEPQKMPAMPFVSEPAFLEKQPGKYFEPDSAEELQDEWQKTWGKEAPVKDQNLNFSQLFGYRNTAGGLAAYAEVVPEEVSFEELATRMKVPPMYAEDDEEKGIATITNLGGISPKSEMSMTLDLLENFDMLRANVAPGPTSEMYDQIVHEFGGWSEATEKGTMFNMVRGEKQIPLATEVPEYKRHTAEYVQNIKDVSLRVGEIPRTLTTELAPLINDQSDWVREEVAKRAPMDVLDKMRNDESQSVKQMVAKRASPETLVQMLGDRDRVIRRGVSERIGRDHFDETLKQTDRFGRTDPDVAEIVERRKKRIDMLGGSEAIEKFYETGELNFSSEMKEFLRNADKVGNQNEVAFMFDELYRGTDLASFRETSRKDWVESSRYDNSALMKESAERLYDGRRAYHSREDFDALVKDNHNVYPEEIVDKYMQREKAVTNQVLDTLYPDTDTIPIFRGTSTHQFESEKGDNVDLMQNSLTSWSVDRKLADEFASGYIADKGRRKGAVVLESTAKKEDIFSTWLQHPHPSLYDEFPGEVLLIGREGDSAKIISRPWEK